MRESPVPMQVDGGDVSCVGVGSLEVILEPE